MPKLLIASGIFHPESGGPATYLYELLPKLQALGWDVRALTYGDAPVTGYPYPLVRIPRRSLPLRLLGYTRAARPWLTWADLVYVHSLDLPLLGSRRAPRVVKIVGDPGWERAIRKGWIAPTEDIDTFQSKRYSLIVNLQKANRARQVRAMDGVIVPSQYLKRMVMGWGVDEASIHVIYNALPPERHTPDITQAEARAQLKLGDEPLFLTVARLTPWKGVDHLIAALARVPDARLMVAGDGDELDALRRQAETSRLADRVTFLGRVSRQQVALYMKAADYTVLYSGYEGLSHTLLESLRAGTPVIASDKGGNPEVVQHGVNGLLVPYVDVDALAAALNAAVQPGKRAELATNVGVGMDRFNFSSMIRRTSDALRQVLA